ncbi:MAG: AraC family transcriptional regulator [Desulfovibrio sp.]
MSNELTQQERKRRINRVIDYIERNLDRPLDLDELASVAPFSKYHFHRIFKESIGETLSQFVRRVRLEAAAHLLASHRHMSVGDIAMHSGFSSSQNFAKAFKKHFAKSPLQYREFRKEEIERTVQERRREHLESNSGNAESNSGHILGKNGNAQNPKEMYSFTEHCPRMEYGVDKTAKEIIMGIVIPKPEVKEMPTWHVAYVRNVGKYCTENIAPLYDKLMPWAGARGLIDKDTVVIGVGWDNPDITPEDKCRYDAAITVPHGTEVSGDVALGEVPAGMYAVFRFRLTCDEIALAWQGITRDWLPQSSFITDMRPCYEICHNSPEEDPEGKADIDICLAVRPR